MRGHDEQTTHMFSYLSPEQLVPANHPLRAVRALTDGLCQVNSPRGTMPGCTFDDPATFGIAFRLTSSATPSGCITETA